MNTDVWTERIREFARERDWEQFHTPKNLAMALSVEASELVEIFQWMTPEEAAAVMSGDKAQDVRDEVADILTYLLRFADVTGIDLDEALTTKAHRNAQRYPADEFRGSSRKAGHGQARRGLSPQALRAVTALHGPSLSYEDALTRVQPVPGLYAISGTEQAQRALGVPTSDADAPLYIGKAERSLVSRDLQTHFTSGKTGQSTVRRSLAALLRVELDLTAQPRNTARPDGRASFGLEPRSDVRLTEWMVRELSVATWEKPEGDERLADIEAEVIGVCNPPLNLTHVHKRWDVLVEARQAMNAQSRQRRTDAGAREPLAP